MVHSISFGREAWKCSNRRARSTCSSGRVRPHPTIRNRELVRPSGCSTRTTWRSLQERRSARRNGFVSRSRLRPLTCSKGFVESLPRVYLSPRDGPSETPGGAGREMPQGHDRVRANSDLLYAARDARFALDPLMEEKDVKVDVHIQPADALPADVEYTWDPDTDILSAQFDAARVGRRVVRIGRARRNRRIVGHPRRRRRSDCGCRGGRVAGRAKAAGAVVADAHRGRAGHGAGEQDEGGRRVGGSRYAPDRGSRPQSDEFPLPARRAARWRAQHRFASREEDLLFDVDDKNRISRSLAAQRASLSTSGGRRDP